MASRCRYKTILGKARKFELDQHRVILCTCSCAASASLRKLDVRQILIDEAGMATEPETLIPLVAFSKAEKVSAGSPVRGSRAVGFNLEGGIAVMVRWQWPRSCVPLGLCPPAPQVVLLGDHKQLRPVVKNEQLQNLGLDRSLFERYHVDAHMLDTQYRMVSRSQGLGLRPRCHHPGP